jgi:hypothetical protein
VSVYYEFELPVGAADPAPTLDPVDLASFTTYWRAMVSGPEVEQPTLEAQKALLAAEARRKAAGEDPTSGPVS